eukprot:TRINITY_DN2230_c1_g1_i1.p1 TRINITY_DN2230_c1_g1~~TRINITY_DN2230_c1_g1_i1.p1  ORF type:complete len:227 (+),score=3.12 TRINITY_DN2230_c1_g1_i1:336-1016(+)
MLCFFAASLLDPGRPPKKLSQKASSPMTSLSIKYCEMCKASKPDRSHHCGRCQRCVLKMDHHCPWINNCVGWRNMKAFVLLCTYVYLFCANILGFSIYYIIVSDFFQHYGQYVATYTLIMIMDVLAIIIGLMLSLFIINHYYLIGRNLTAIEYWRARQQIAETSGIPQGFRSRWCPMCTPVLESPYDVGTFENFSQVFGRNPLLWPFPLPSGNGDGVDWQVNPSML